MANENDLIRRGDLKNLLLKRSFFPAIVAAALKEIPEVDAVEVVHARWVERRYDGMGGGWYTLFHCSECDTPSAKPRNFCSFCGAKMTEGSVGE